MKITITLPRARAIKVQRFLDVLNIPESAVADIVAEFVASEQWTTDAELWTGGYTYPNRATAARAAANLYRRRRARAEFLYWDNGRRYAEMFTARVALKSRVV